MAEATSRVQGYWRYMEKLKIKQATAKGYIEVPVGGVFDGSYLTSKTRRGRVQDGGRLCPTLTAGEPEIYIYEGCIWSE